MRDTALAENRPTTDEVSVSVSVLSEIIMIITPQIFGNKH